MHTILKETQLGGSGTNVKIEQGVFVLFDFSTHKMLSQRLIPFDLTFFKDYKTFTDSGTPLVLFYNNESINSFKHKLDSSFNPLGLDGKVTSSMVSEFLKSKLGEFGYLDNAFEEMGEYMALTSNEEIFEIAKTMKLKAIYAENTSKTTDFNITFKTMGDKPVTIKNVILQKCSDVLLDIFDVNSFDDDVDVCVECTGPITSVINLKVKTTKK